MKSSIYKIELLLLWWPRQESNQRHTELQSVALPTELQGHKWRSRRGSNPRSPPWQGGVLNHFTTGPFGCGDRTRTCDLRVMSPTSCQTAPLRDVNISVCYNGGWWGIWTPAGREAPGSFQDCSLQPDLGNHPLYLVDLTGLEPVTDRLWAGCSNHWAIGPEA